MMSKIAQLLPEWGPVRWTVAVLAVVILLFGGVSLFHTPDYQVMYSQMRICMPSAERKDILAFYTVEIGNTGYEAQEHVKLLLLKEAMDRKILPVFAQNHGVSDRPFTISNDTTVTTIDIGRLEPEARVKITLALSYPDGRQPHTWEQIFQGVEPAKGRARAGDPAMTMVGRVWFDMFGRWFPF